MLTMTRKPEQPEDPEVFDGDADPSIILSERAVKVSMFGKEGSWLNVVR